MASHPRTEALSAIVFAEGQGGRYRAGRSVRALARLGISLLGDRWVAIDELAAVMQTASTPLWLIRAGAWPAASGISFPPPSGTGRPLCALGAVQSRQAGDAPGQPAMWREILQASGGHLDGHVEALRHGTFFTSVYLELPLVRDIAPRLAQQPLAEAVIESLRARQARVIRWAGLDVHEDNGLRVAEVITSLQIGGAERMVLELSASLRGMKNWARIITTGQPTRAAFAPPQGTIDVSESAGGRPGRMGAAAFAALQMNADLVHVHLLNAGDLTPFRDAGLPVAMTVHNMRPGWHSPDPPTAFGAPDLLIACSRRVEQDLREAGVSVPVRTVWNGIDFDGYHATTTIEAQARALRAKWGADAHDAVLLALANPRRQKRLSRLPGILSRVRERTPRNVLLVIAGEPSAATPEGREAEEDVKREITRTGMAQYVHSVPATVDAPAYLQACDLLVSVSAWEGLSMAHLEALAANRRLVATQVGGTGEIAWRNPAVTLLPPEFTDEAAVEAILNALAAPPLEGAGRQAARVNFDRFRMAQRYEQLLPRAIAAAHRPHPGSGLWLVSNNFSTGGAQSSARRLLTALAAGGHKVRAAVVQEQQDRATPGRVALLQAGIKVCAMPLLDSCDPAVTVQALLEAIDADPPSAVIMWNLVTQVKVLLADSLLDVPLFDVSPGEMYFASLEKYFAAPRPGLPYRTPREYGRRLAGVIVKYQGERELAERLLGAPASVIPNGVPIGPAPPVRRAGGEKLILGTAARLSPQKKLEELLAALRLAHHRLSPYVLRIAGGVDGADDAYPARLRELAAGLNVEWLGDVLDVQTFLSALDLFVMISEPAGCPNASLEAMAAGLGVIATDCGGAREQVIDSQTGRLVPRGDAAAFAKALLKAAADRTLLRRWGSAARTRVREHFSIDRMAQDYQRTLGLAR